MKFSVCTDAVFRGMDTLEAMAIVKEAGIHAFEFWSWGNKDIEAIRAKSRELELSVAIFGAAEPICLVDETKREQCVSAILRTIETARRLNCHRLLVTVGDELPDVPRDAQRGSIVAGLKACVPHLSAAGVILAVEPLNTIVDHPGYFLSDSDEAFSIIDEVNSPNVKLLYDVYHQQITEGNLIPTLISHIDRIGHIHIADHPGRHEPGTGEINYANIFKALEECGYSGYVGAEYMPIHEPLAGLKELAQTGKFH